MSTDAGGAVGVAGVLAVVGPADVPGDPNKSTAHILVVSYRPDEGKTRGDLRRVFRVVTDLPGEPALEVTATCHAEP